jgi:hypothetical protein
MPASLRLGSRLAADDGAALGASVGEALGASVGEALGAGDGCAVGVAGSAVGWPVVQPAAMRKTHRAVAWRIGLIVPPMLCEDHAPAWRRAQQF